VQAARVRSLFAWALHVAAATCLLAGCTKVKVVEWDEEVLLNTGETIWVHRKTSYHWGNSTPLPFDWGYEQDRRNAISFEYRNRRYAHDTDGMLQVLAISPKGTPRLVLAAADYAWQWEHDYYCTQPSYVQLEPDATGTSWSWPPRIESWLYELPTNLLLSPPRPEEPAARSIDTAQKAKRNLGVFAAGPHFQRIDAQYQTGYCKHRG
jgi:hypothetical protein